MELTYDILEEFALIFPLFMSYLWMTGGIVYYYRWEDGGKQRVDEPPELKHYPGVSVIVPAHNESYAILETIESLKNLQYPEFEIIVVNDGSTDETADILNAFSTAYSGEREHLFRTNVNT
jgi:biofilm PGA synthesis N-glycosyltransferase PgaC